MNLDKSFQFQPHLLYAMIKVTVLGTSAEIVGKTVMMIFWGGCLWLRSF